MADDLLAHPEIQNLLQEADSILRVLEQVGKEDPGNFRQALDDIYRDLGRAVHQLAPRPDAFDDEEATAVTGRVAEAMVAPEPTPDDEPTPPAEPPPTLPPEEHTASNLAHRGVASSTTTRRAAKHQRAEERRAAVAASRERRGLPTGKRPTSSTDASFGRAAVRSQAGVGEGAWLEQLGDLLELIALPAHLDDPHELAAEASLVQWATVGLDAAWQPYPPAIRAALLGLLAARARNVQERLAVDVGPRIALERLGAYREQAGLSKVEGLYPERSPTTDSWAGDSREWWSTLIEGLRRA